MSLTVTTRVAMAHPQAAANSTPPAWPHFTAASSTNPATTSAVRGEASLAGGSAEHVGLAQAVHDSVRAVERVLAQTAQRRYQIVAGAVVLGMASQLVRRPWIIK